MWKEKDPKPKLYNNALDIKIFLRLNVCPQEWEIEREGVVTRVTIPVQQRQPNAECPFHACIKSDTPPNSGNYKAK